MSRAGLRCLALAAIAALPSLACAQAYPHEPILFIVPHSPIGAGDIFARTIGPKVGDSVTSWQVILAPVGTPRPIVDRLYRETAKALKLPDVIERLATQGGNELVGSTPDDFAKLIKADLVAYEQVIKAANI